MKFTALSNGDKTIIKKLLLFQTKKKKLFVVCIYYYYYYYSSVEEIRVKESNSLSLCVATNTRVLDLHMNLERR